MAANNLSIILGYLLLFSDKKCERAKDMHLLKRLTAVLRSREVEPGERQKNRS